ncbi:MAG: TolC family protein [Bacteroidales bacterium]|jgi:hypothetical protein|nr:TolC family protein [Bacteroidales bacterium]
MFSSTSLIRFTSRIRWLILLCRKIINDLRITRKTGIVNESSKTGRHEPQLKQAQKAYSLAETSFRTGVITNLELLDASTAVSESELMLLKGKIDFAASVYRLKASLGERIYQP